MSKFKVGDIVRRKKEYIDEESLHPERNGMPVRVVSIKEACNEPGFYLELNVWDGNVWWEDYYELAEPSQEYSTITVEKALAFLMQEGYSVSISKK